MTLRATLLVSAMTLLGAGSAAAQPVAGLYLGAGAGVNFADVRDDGPSLPHDFRAGPAAGLSLGYGFGNGLRLEAEGTYRRNDAPDERSVLALTASGATRTVRSGGYEEKYGLMANALFDLDLGLPVFPYLGAGIGVQWVRERYEAVGTSVFPLGSLGTLFSTDRTEVDGARARFAAQGIAGLAVPLAFVPGLSLTADYRFLYVRGGDDGRGTVTTILGNSNTPTTSTGTARFATRSAETFNHTVLLGLRYAFGAPSARPAPVPAPMAALGAAPGAARTYIVFFDWDRAELTERARQILAEAASNARGVGSTRIEVAGHADRSGTPQYNQRLSQRRAEVVAAELVARGLSRAEIVVTAFGESRPLVPTADGVREPQNRRVEIVLR